MAIHDIAVRVDNKTHRLISNGTVAAMFNKQGNIVQRLTVLRDDNTMPDFGDESGNPVKIRRGARPCSCGGGVWKTRISELTVQL